MKLMKQKYIITVTEELEYGMMMALSAIDMDQNLIVRKRIKKKSLPRKPWKHEIAYEILSNEETLTSLELKEKMNLKTINSANDLLNKLRYNGKAMVLPNISKNRYKNFKAL